MMEYIHNATHNTPLLTPELTQFTTSLLHVEPFETPSYWYCCSRATFSSKSLVCVVMADKFREVIA